MMSEQQQVVYEKSSKVRAVTNFYPPPASKLVAPWRIEVFSASHEPERWRAHRQAAQQSLVKRGLAGIDQKHANIRRDCSTYVAEATVNHKPVGGVNLNLPDASGRLPVLDWLQGYLDTQPLANFIKSLSASGIVQCSGLWADPEQCGRGLSGDLARAYIPMIQAAKAHFYLTICPEHTLAAFCTLGSRRVTEFPPFPYPDERYQTFIIIGDVNRWPADLAAWAREQAAAVDLHSTETSWPIQPMRTPKASVEKRPERIKA